MARRKSRSEKGRRKTQKPEPAAGDLNMQEHELAEFEDEEHKARQVKRRRNGMAVVAGKDGPRQAPPAPEDVLRADLPLQGLTPKQEQFAQILASGVSKSEAYRRVYDVGADTKATTIHRKAVQIAQNGKVVARLIQLTREQTRETTHSAARIRNQCIDTLLDTLVGEATPANRLKAVELLGKIPGVDLFRETVLTQHEDRSPTQVAEELQKRVSELLAAARASESTAAQPIDKAEE